MLHWESTVAVEAGAVTVTVAVEVVVVVKSLADTRERAPRTVNEIAEILENMFAGMCFCKEGAGVCCFNRLPFICVFKTPRFTALTL